jgi:hypothetical protein
VLPSQDEAEKITFFLSISSKADAKNNDLKNSDKTK